ncbi:tyrosinase family oxidase copper chaperone [Streptomyces sp. NPDC050523]|uniref:tyrosinase family oxidase copper chaperone n=1 Tax=Streptomyces sp. NPDC050523 TaxID=3365622 RepID=UPI0037A15D3F
MTVSADDGVPTGAEPETGVRADHGPQRRPRRVIRRGLLASAVALALAPLVAASRAPRPGAGHEGPGDVKEEAFDEVYRGRRIKGTPLPGQACGPEGCGWQVTVDGHPLHLMRRADGTWLTMVDHYSSYRTSLEATRAAVDELGPGRRLRDLAPGPFGERDAHMGGHHGVRA